VPFALWPRGALARGRSPRPRSRWRPARASPRRARRCLLRPEVCACHAVLGTYCEHPSAAPYSHTSVPQMVQMEVPQPRLRRLKTLKRGARILGRHRARSWLRAAGCRPPKAPRAPAEPLIPQPAAAGSGPRATPQRQPGSRRARPIYEGPEGVTAGKVILHFPTLSYTSVYREPLRDDTTQESEE
jgi:hypothetical protein